MNELTDSDFRISIGDDSDHEKLTVEIYFKEMYVAIITQENGIDKAKIEIKFPTVMQ